MLSLPAEHHTGKHLDALKQIMFEKLALLAEEMDQEAASITAVSVSMLYCTGVA